MNGNLHEDTPIIDMHTHCFPDDLAPKAVPLLAGKAGITPHTDGTIAGLKQSMKAAGIHISVIQPIATASRYQGQPDNIFWHHTPGLFKLGRRNKVACRCRNKRSKISSRLPGIFCG